MDYFSAIIGVVGTILGGILSYAAFHRNSKKDSESEGKEAGTMLTEIGYIKGGIDRIERKQDAQDALYQHGGAHVGGGELGKVGTSSYRQARGARGAGGRIMSARKGAARCRKFKKWGLAVWSFAKGYRRRKEADESPPPRPLRAHHAAEIIIRIKDGRAETVVAALDSLERLYGAAFYRIFKSITVDNGSEFADADGIERSARRKDAKRTTVYYCHAYSSCERGTNENINRMIRRQFPKGTDFDKVTAAEVKRVETWLNNYPREILGFMSSAEAFEIAFDRAA